MEQTISIQQIFNELKAIEKNMVTKQDVKSLVDSIEIMSNPDSMKQIAESLEDIKHSRDKEVNSVDDMLNELK